MNESNSEKKNCSRDVIDDLKALSCCWRQNDTIAGCNACPFLKFKPGEYACNPYYRLVDSLMEILKQLSGDKAKHFLAVFSKCYNCEEYYCDPCLFFDESVEVHAEVLFHHIYDFFRDIGLYNEDGSVSEKGSGIRVSDALALLMATGQTKDSRKKKRDSLL